MYNFLASAGAPNNMDVFFFSVERVKKKWCVFRMFDTHELRVVYKTSPAYSLIRHATLFLFHSTHPVCVAVANRPCFIAVVVVVVSDTYYNSVDLSISLLVVIVLFCVPKICNIFLQSFRRCFPCMLFIVFAVFNSCFWVCPISLTSLRCPNGIILKSCIHLLAVVAYLSTCSLCMCIVPTRMSDHVAGFHSNIY